MKRLITALALACVVAPVCAEEAKPARITCWTVRRAVKIYNEADLIAMARSAGISEAEIERAKRCLNR